jgi:hypothetical protein
MNATTQDPFESATDATLPSAVYYAQVQCDAWFCALVKGQGKVVFDPNVHPIDQRRTAINLSLAPIAEQTVQFPLVREMIAESVEWAKIIWPSARALGITSARELHGKWAKVEIVPTGRKYTNRSGEEKEATTFKFAALYPDEAAARAAYLAGGQATEPTPASTPSTPAPTNGAPATTNPKERETALAFLKVLVPQWGMDFDKVAAGIASNPVIARHFTVQSPEVVELMAALAK